FNINLHRVEENHWHCDFQFVAEVEGSLDDYEYSDDDMKWFSREELRSQDLEMPENARKTALRVLER
ncbi:MAG: hypothetical protein ABEJ83_05220, partial [Candidatus Nanohaloarchaea archaeon]